jgi:uncharacterized membrane protein YkoI
MKKKTMLISAAGVVVVLGAAGIAVAVADPFDSSDRLTGTTLDNASAAALAEVGEGTVAEAESSTDLDHAYDVQVRLSNGDDVEVALDEDYTVVWVDRDDESPVSNGSASTGEATTAPTSGTGTAGTSGAISPADAEDVPLTDAETAAATEAALAAATQLRSDVGTVTDIDRSDDADHSFEVEVSYTDGTDIDVDLDAAFTVVRTDVDNT